MKITMYMIIGEFRAWLKVRGYSEVTIENYSRTLDIFDDYVRDVSLGKRSLQYPNYITLEDIEGFCECERIKGKQIATVNNYIAGIRAFMKFLFNKGLNDLDYHRILMAREPQTKVHALEKESMEKLIEYMKNDNSKDELTKTRDYCIALVLYHTGMRVGELSKLKISQLREEFQIEGKGGSLRLQYLFQPQLKVLDLYLFLRRRLKVQSEYVFISHANNTKGAPLHRNSIEKIIREAAKKAGIEKTRPHKIRHTYATQLLEHGAELPYIAKLMGHKNITTTQIYLDYTNSRLRKTQCLLPQIG